MKKRPIGIDLFAGAGGLSLGFEQAGFDVKAAVEIDPIHCATHEYNFPNCKTICASVVDLTGKKIREIAALEDDDIDVVFGGAPCQGFSMIGKRALDDPRNHLVFHYVRIVKELKPKYCVFENVKGLTLGKHASFLQELIDAIEKIGYSILQPYQVLNAADFGVPQSRERLILVGYRSDQRSPSYPAKQERSVTVWDAIGDLPDADDFEVLNYSDEVSTKWKTTASYARQLRGLSIDPADFSHPRKLHPNLLTSSTRTSHTEESIRRFLETAPGKTESISRFLKLNPYGLCNTLRAGTDSARGGHTSARPIHPTLSRVITVREAARLHSYPDWFRFHVTKWHGFRQIGNSVPPKLGRAVGQELLRAMKLKPIKPVQVLDLDKQDLLALDMSAAAHFFRVPKTVIAQRDRKPASDKRVKSNLTPL